MNHQDGSPANYRILARNESGTYLASKQNLADILGGVPAEWRCQEIGIGEGYLNQIYQVTGTKDSLVVKQALPYMRFVGEEWPLTIRRSYFENQALTHQHEITPELVPQVYHYDNDLSCLVMEYLQPHRNLRKGLLAATVYPKLVDDITTFLARNLFFTSDLHLSAGSKRAAMASYAGNHELTTFAAELIFCEPYQEHEHNRWTSPQLDNYAVRWRTDAALHKAIAHLHHQFVTNKQALLHGDLHTGSIMVTATETKVIDPEFAGYGPMGFDLGTLLANLLTSYFAQAGYEKHPGERDEFRHWLLHASKQLWEDFAYKFVTLWSATAPNPDLQQEYLQKVFADTVGFCGAELCRHILGMAHNIDFENIAEPNLRATCEARTLELAYQLLVAGSEYLSIDAVIATATKLHQTTPELS